MTNNQENFMKKSAGSWGQDGGGSSANIQRIATNIQVVPCEVGMYVPCE